MLIYGLIPYACNSCQDPNGASTFTRVVVSDMLCRPFLWGGSLPSMTNHYRQLSRSFTPVPFSQARTLVASLHVSCDLPKLALGAPEHTQLIQISDPPHRVGLRPPKRDDELPWSLLYSCLRCKYGVLNRIVWLWRHKLTCVDPSVKKLVNHDELGVQSASMLETFETVGASNFLADSMANTSLNESPHGKHPHTQLSTDNSPFSDLGL